MSVQQTTGIRELSADELDQVTGGNLEIRGRVGIFTGFTLGAAVIGVVGHILNWLFD